MLKVLDFHKKLYDKRWNNDKTYLYFTMEQMETEFSHLASEEGLTEEQLQEMLEQLYIPPYKYDLLPEHLRHSESAKRETLGRPSIGLTKKVSITLPEDIWNRINREIEEVNDLKSMSAYFRKMALDHFKRSL
ncbi:hypothetical protein [Priestia koreensis]|uniref:hypothetical protein n=1 Tax=Priestia koreensis TaxID=284581 RepID=UPI000A9D2153|nr:hypothetical protein [Priestia koreensis]